jgi:hypothetical protein
VLAVLNEPVSKVKFPVNGKITAKFRKITRYNTSDSRENIVVTIDYRRIPWKAEQGFFPLTRTFRLRAGTIIDCKRTAHQGGTASYVPKMISPDPARRRSFGTIDLPLNFHPAAIRASAVSVTP